MRRRALVALAAIGIASAIVWRSQLFLVAKPGEVPLPLTAAEPVTRRVARFDAVLPAVPIGLRRLRPADEVLLVHYWAPWERHGLTQISALDSLARLETLAGLRVAVVCFDPFPSVARYVGRHRLRVDVLLDREHALARDLPCPSLPYTYVVDRAGRIAIEAPGEVDWLSPVTRATLEALIAEPKGAVEVLGANTNAPADAGAFVLPHRLRRRSARDAARSAGPARIRRTAPTRRRRC